MEAQGHRLHTQLPPTRMVGLENWPVSTLEIPSWYVKRKMNISLRKEYIRRLKNMPRRKRQTKKTLSGPRGTKMRPAVRERAGILFSQGATWCSKLAIAAD